MPESPLGDIEIWSETSRRFTIHRSVALAAGVPIDGAKLLIYTKADLTRLLLAEYAAELAKKKGKKK